MRFDMVHWGWFLVVQLFVLFPKSHAETLRLDNGELVQYLETAGQPKWKLVPYLWFTKSVNVTCSFTKDFKVYKGGSLSELSDKVDRNDNVWCGWPNLLGQHSCKAQLSPFGPVHVGIQHTHVSTRSCSMELEESWSWMAVGQTILGALLFQSADRLSSSIYFRLGTGSAGVMCLSLLILLFLVARTLPNKKSGLALFAVFGSTFTGLMKYLFGHWIPSVEQLMYNWVAAAYLAISGLVGLALTYYYDREDNVRLHNILKYGLKMVGLLLMAFSTSMLEASATLCVVLLATQLIHPGMYLWRRREFSEQALSDLVSHSPRTLKNPKTAFKPTASRFKPKTPGTQKQGEETSLSSEDEGLSLESKHARTPSSDSEGAFEQASKVPLPGDEDSGNERTSLDEDGTPIRTHVPYGAAQSDSPWLKKGLALNLETGRTVKMNGPTWNKLMLQGYELDRQQGTLTPPSKGTSNGTTTPASRVKARRS